MIEAGIAILVVWIILYIYSIAGSIDFGSSFWSMYYGKRNTKAGELANRFLSPTWEVTNTILVLLVVAFMGLFPKGIYMLGTLLLVPVSLILLLIIIRSAFMVFSYSVSGYRNVLRVVSGITGVLVPALLISALPVTQGGFIDIVDGTEVLLFNKWLTSPVVYMYMLFGLSSALFLSSIFLTDYANESRDEKAYLTYRRNSVVLGPATLVIAMITLSVLNPEAAWFFDQLQRYRGWFLLSIVAFLIGYSALWWKNQHGFKKGRPRVSVVMVALQYFLATFAYGAAHLPYIVYPHLRVQDAFTNINTFYSLLWTITIGTAILLPGFIAFWRLFLKDKRYLRQK
ncbi:cytochrome d ubiquinol oxidase subunit II [Hazenella coriacea]|uniref:Cytochrome bd-I ubiquinol oxidase subunit 2 apoprotein n=1 Tax=Hazenella coriacea TaxID=1179467 RepID=A0A4R3LA16_9BACL|nr:cytochrome d ubiquinol oxidase subunit II [Hazenella coriacea]TCS95990.1 cytochrome bd-I ubiquinol oxidase subunit 2 apoprotein [Hazenella coriacea]